MVGPVIEEKGDMIWQNKLEGRKWKIHGFALFLFLAVSVVGVLITEKSMAQVSPNTLSFTYTGNVIPSRGRLTPLLRGEGLRAGPFRVHPFLGVAEIYSDNVFRRNVNRQSDFVHTIAPGLQVQLPFARFHKMVLDYRASQWISQRFSVNNVLRQDLTGQVLLDFPGGLNLNFQGGYIKGFDFRGAAVDVQAREPTKWHTKTFFGEAETIGSQLGVRLRVRGIDWKFENNDQAPRRDRLSSRGDLTFFGLIAPKTFVLLNFGVTRQVYDQNTQLDSMSYRLNTGLRWRASGKTTGEIQVGYQILNFDRAPVIQPPGSLLSSGGNGREIVQVSGNLNWRPTSRSSIRVQPFRTIRQSGVFGTSIFTQTGMNLNARYAIGTRTSLNGNFQYSNDEFVNDQGSQTSQNRTDNRLRGSIGLTYRAVRWLGVTTQYQYQQRSSTINTFDFYANTLMVSIQGVF